MLKVSIIDGDLIFECDCPSMPGTDEAVKLLPKRGNVTSWPLRPIPSDKISPLEKAWTISVERSVTVSEVEFIHGCRIVSVEEEGGATHWLVVCPDGACIPCGSYADACDEAKTSGENAPLPAVILGCS